MKLEDCKPGTIVTFADKVYMAPYAPYYDAYRGRTYKIIGRRHGHISLQDTADVGSRVAVDGWVHPDELEPAP